MFQPSHQVKLMLEFNTYFKLLYYIPTCLLLYISFYFHNLSLEWVSCTWASTWDVYGSALNEYYRQPWLKECTSEEALFQNTSHLKTSISQFPFVDEHHNAMQFIICNIKSGLGSCIILCMILAYISKPLEASGHGYNKYWMHLSLAPSTGLFP